MLITNKNNQKRIVLITIFILLIFFLLNNISATNLCWVQGGTSPGSAAANCNSAYGGTGKVIMYVSGATNAHSALTSQANYNNVLCCNFGGGNTTCNGNNEVIALYASTNSHAESPTLVTPNYHVNVCYDSLQNSRRIDASQTCNTINNETAILYISNITNAHVEDSGLSPHNYGSIICSTVNITQQGTNLITVTSPNGGENWTVGSTHAITWTATSGISNVKIELSRNGGSTWETLFASVSASSGSQNWAVSGSTTNNALIRISDAANSATFGKSNAAFNISNGPSLPCTLDSASWNVTQTLQGKNVSLNIGASNCDGKEISFKVFRKSNLLSIFDTPCTSISGCKNPVGVTIAGGSAKGIWTAYPADASNNYSFTATLVAPSGTSIDSSNRIQVLDNPLVCQNVVTCGDYLNNGTCSNDLCTKAAFTVDNSQVPANDTFCSTPGINCFCSWNSATSKCGGAFTVATGAVCGNGITEAPEQCDMGAQNGVAGSGCSSTCTIVPATFCDNNNQIESGEICDGTKLNGQTCQTLGYDSGTLSCSNCAFNVSQCSHTVILPYCGNSNVDRPNVAGVNESCDPDTGTSVFLSTENSCVKLSQNLGMDSYNGGTLGCTGYCTFDTSQCTSPPGTPVFCGDGVRNQLNETCDGKDLGGNTCQTLGYSGGTLGCTLPTSSRPCQFDTSLCKPGITNLPPTVSLNATSTTVTTGSSTILNWSSTGADSCIGSWAGGSVGTSGIYTVQNLLSTTTYTITCTNSANGLSAYQLITITVTNVPGSPSVNFNVVPSTIAKGQFVVFAWSSSNADSCTGSWTTGNIGINGIDSFIPSATANYTVTCTNSANGASASQKKTVTVTNIQLPPEITFNATSSTITSGGTATLTWSAPGADSCTGSWTGSIATSGTVDLKPSSTTNYTVTCTNSAGSSSQIKTVTVTTTVGLPNVSISAVPSTITKNQSSTLIWISSGADSCSATDPVGWTSKTVKSGSDTVSPTTTTNYTITCRNSQGSVSDKTTVSVSSIPIPPVVSLDSTSSTITSGGTATLTWSAPGADSCTGSWTTGNIGTTGTATVIPTAPSTTYTITCTNSAGSASQIEVITVTNVPGVPTVTFNVNPSTIVSGDPTTLTWSATGTGTISCTGSWTTGNIGASGTVDLKPSSTTNYTITCTNSAGSASQKRTVTVAPTAISICGDGNANEVYDTGRIKYCDPGNPDKGIASDLPITSCSVLSSIYQSGVGSLTCASDCTYDISKCVFKPGVTATCGDNVINNLSEECDGNFFRSGYTCKSLGYDNGALSCNNCKIDRSGCAIPIRNVTGAKNLTGNNIGTCYYQEDSTDTCQGDGYLTVTLTASWQWAAGNPSHNDPQNLASNCKSTVETFQCPAQIPLPFFEWYNLVSALAIIAFVYLLIEFGKKKKVRVALK